MRILRFGTRFPLFLSLWFVAGWCSAGDWPALRGSNGDGLICVPELQPDFPAEIKLLWSREYPDDEAFPEGKPFERYSTYASLVVAGGRVYAPVRSGGKDVLLCLDAENGAEVWRFACDLPPLRKPYGNGLRATPLVYNKGVYFVNYQADVFCLDLQGQLRWKRELGKDYAGKLPPFGTSASPVVLGGKLICAVGGKGASFVALDPLIGATLWQSGDDAASYGTPLLARIGGVDQIIGTTAVGVVSMDVADGHELWRFAFIEDWGRNIAAPLVRDDVVCVSNNTLGTAAFRISLEGGKWQTTRLWASRNDRMVMTSPVLGEDTLFYQNGKSELVNLSLADGKTVWSAPNIGKLWGGLVRINEDKLLAVVDTGELIFMQVNAKNCSELARFKPLEVNFHQPAVADGKVFIRDFKKVVCVSLVDRPQFASAKSLPRFAAVSVEHENGAQDWRALWAKNDTFFKIGWLTALAFGLLGMRLFYARRLFSASNVTLTCVLAMAVGMYVQGIASMGRYSFVHKTQFLTILTASVAAFAALFAGLDFDASRKESRCWRVWTTLAVAALGTFAVSRMEMATVDVRMVLLSSEIRGPSSAVGDMLVVLILAVVAFVIGLGTRTRSSALWSSVFAMCVGAALGYSVRTSGFLFTVACLAFPALTTSMFVCSRALSYFVAPALGVLLVTFAFIECALDRRLLGQFGPLVLFAAMLIVFIYTHCRALLPSAFQRPASYLARTMVCAAAVFVVGTHIVGWWASETKRRELAALAGFATVYKPDVSNWETQWPLFRGPFGTGVVPNGNWPSEWSREVTEAGEEKARGILWKAAVPAPGFSSPVVWGGRIVCTGGSNESREVFCFATDTGTLLWRTVVGSDRLGYEEALSGWAAPTPACDGQRVYAVFGTGEIAALDLLGNIVWQKTLGRLKTTYGFGTSPVLWGDRLLLQLDVLNADNQPDGRLLALACATGEQLWSSPRRENNSYSTPLLIRTKDGDQILTCANPHAIAYCPADGRELWRASVLAGDVVTTPVFASGLLLSCNKGAPVCAVRLGGSGDVTTEGVAWRRELDDIPDTSSPVCDGERFYFGSADGKIVCVNVASGEKLWEDDCGGTFYASALLIGTEVHFWDTKGVCYRYSASAEKVYLGQCKLGAAVRATPAYVGSRIYVRSEKYLFCIGSKRSTP